MKFKTTKAPRTIALAAAALAAVGSLGFMPASAQAGSHFNVRVDVRDGDFCSTDRPVDVVRYEEQTTSVWVEPVYRTTCDRVWVEPEYRTTCDRVWHDAQVQNLEERVWVPARFEVRRGEHRDHSGRS